MKSQGEVIRTAAFAAEHLAFSYTGQDALRDVTLAARSGEFLGIIGPNGAGKSTLLRVIGGILRAYRGKVEVLGQDLPAMTSRQRARCIGFVAQETHFSLDFSVEDIVSMGRYPYLGPFQPLTTADREAIQQAMESSELEGLRRRSINSLSSGERQRAVIARALAQMPKIMLLDEPTSHLDLYHQHRIMELLGALNRRSITVAVVNHDLNIASQYCDRLVLMHRGSIYKEGTPGWVIDEETIQKVYNVRCSIVKHPEKNVPQVLLK